MANFAMLYYLQAVSIMEIWSSSGKTPLLVSTILELIFN